MGVQFSLLVACPAGPMSRARVRPGVRHPFLKTSAKNALIASHERLSAFSL